MNVNDSRSFSLRQTALLEALYRVPQVAPDSTPAAGDASVGGEAAPACVNLEGFLEKLPSGRRKATFWNAWKSRFFRLQDGFLYYYQVKLPFRSFPAMLPEGNNHHRFLDHDQISFNVQLMKSTFYDAAEQSVGEAECRFTTGRWCRREHGQ